MARKHHPALPTRADFDPTGVDVEAQAAAEVLGGTTFAGAAGLPRREVAVGRRSTHPKRCQ